MFPNIIFLKILMSPNIFLPLQTITAIIIMAIIILKHEVL